MVISNRFNGFLERFDTPKTVETVNFSACASATPLKQGVNETLI